jgi:hypothetical protein
MNKAMNLYTKLLRTFLKAALFFGVVLGLLVGTLVDWRAGVLYGMSSAFLFWIGVSGILLVLSVRKHGSHHG